MSVNGSIEIKKIDIILLDTDAIVNAANELLTAGGGVCGAIFRAAGYTELRDACRSVGHCATGNAVITPGFKLRAKYIIHAVGPVWYGGGRGEPELLRGAYRNALQRALEQNCRSVGFPLISAGIFGYPLRDAWREAVSACREFLDAHPDLPMRIVFAVLSDEVMATGLEVLKECTK